MQSGKNWLAMIQELRVEFTGDAAGAVERLAVSLIIDCRKSGIIGMPHEEEHDDSGVTGGPNTPEGVETPPAPTQPPPEEEDIDLPF